MKCPLPASARLVAVAIAPLGAPALAQNLTVTGVEPAQNAMAERSDRIAVTFDRPVRREDVAGGKVGVSRG